MAWAMTRKVGPPCELQTLLEPQKGVLRGIPEDCGLNSCPVPCGCGEQPLKTTLLQEASRPFRACQALEGQITLASRRQAATRRNLSQEPTVPEIRLSRSPVQRFSGASEGFGAPSPSRPVRGEFRPHPAIRWPHSRSMLLFNPKCRCRSARPVADPGAGSRPPLAPAYSSRSADPSPGRQTRPRGTSNLALFSATGFLMLFTPSFQRIRDRQKDVQRILSRTLSSTLHNFFRQDHVQKISVLAI